MNNQGITSDLFKELCDNDFTIRVESLSEAEKRWYFETSSYTAAIILEHRNIVKEIDEPPYYLFEYVYFAEFIQDTWWKQYKARGVE
jgi:hypothetical protein